MKKGVVFVKSHGSRLLNVILAFCVLVSFTPPAGGYIYRISRPPKVQLEKDLDEHPNPGLAGKPKNLIFLISAGGFAAIPIFLDSVQRSKKTTFFKPSSGANGIAE